MDTNQDNPLKTNKDDSQSVQTVLKPSKKPRKDRKGTSLKNVNLQRMEKKLRNILDREVNHLLVLSRQTLLEKDQSAALVNYLKLLKQLQKTDTDDEESLTDAELAKIANLA